MKARVGILAGALALAVSSGCARERAGLTVALAPPVASRFVVHGNCVAGWFVSADVIVGETRGVDVAIESVSLRVEDATAGLLGDLLVDAASLRDRFGEHGAAVPGRGSIRIPVSVGTLAGSVAAPAISGSIVVSGEVVALDEQGRVRMSFRIPATVRVDGVPLPSSGACPPPGA